MGRVRGSTCKPWTDREWEVIRADLDATPERDHWRTRRLAPLLPGRSKEDIHGSLNRERWRQAGKCGCGKLLSKRSKHKCDECLAKIRATRVKTLQKGLCVACRHNPIDDDGSVTECSQCLQKRHRAYGKVNHTRRRTKGSRVKSKPTYNLLKWLNARSTKFLVESIPEGSWVVDLFGGSGDIGLRAAREGHELLGYNDVHPMLVAFMRVLREGRVDDLCRGIQRSRYLDPEALAAAYTHWCSWGCQIMRESERHRLFGPWNRDHSLFRAVLLYSVCHTAKNRDLARLDMGAVVKGLGDHHRARMREAHAFLAENETEITCLDALEAIPYYDCSRTLFVADPPWPRSDKYEYSFKGRHAELVRALTAAQGDFLLTMQSSKLSLVAMSPCPYLYFFRNHGGPRCLIGSSFPLSADPRLSVVDKSHFGYLNGVR